VTGCLERPVQRSSKIHVPNLEAGGLASQLREFPSSARIRLAIVAKRASQQVNSLRLQ
jgi:hypothetical protein